MKEILFKKLNYWSNTIMVKWQWNNLVMSLMSCLQGKTIHGRWGWGCTAPHGGTLVPSKFSHNLTHMKLFSQDSFSTKPRLFFFFFFNTHSGFVAPLPLFFFSFWNNQSFDFHTQLFSFIFPKSKYFNYIYWLEILTFIIL